MTGARRARFRPGLWPTVMTALALALLLALGKWQLDRLEWKEALITTREAALRAPPLDLTRGLGPAGPEEFYRNVRLEGQFTDDPVFLLQGKAAGGEAGVHVIGTFRLAPSDAPAGPALILVNRGFWPGLAPARAEIPPPRGGERVLEGVLLPPPGRGWFAPENDPGRDIWFRIDPVAMGAARGQALAPYAVVAAPDRTSPLRPVAARPRLVNNHLQYAVTWFAFAGVLAVIYILFGIKRGREAASTSEDGV
ncbi:MAG: SURF1 family protein [Alphaproteobacteria bacterium]